jgi:hypothetical protein
MEIGKNPRGWLDFSCYGTNCLKCATVDWDRIGCDVVSLMI